MFLTIISFNSQSLYIYGGYEYNIGMMSDFKRINLGSNAENYVWEDLVYKEDPIDVDGEEEEPDDYSVSNLEPRKQNKPPRPSNYPGNFSSLLSQF